MNDRTVAEEVWQYELAAHRQFMAQDKPAGRAATASDLIHIAADGQRHGPDQCLRGFPRADGLRCTAILPGPVEALVFSTRAVLITYALAAHLCGPDIARDEYQHVSVLWLQRAGRWLTVWVHVTPLEKPQAIFEDTSSCGRLVAVVDCSAEGEDAADELTLGEHQWEAIACERASVHYLAKHDVAAAASAAAAGLTRVETNGSRHGRDRWLALVGDWRRTLAPPDIGPMQVIAVTPGAMLVTYTLDTHGTYDGLPFSSHEVVSSLWLRRQNHWQNVFVQTTTCMER